MKDEKNSVLRRRDRLPRNIPVGDSDADQPAGAVRQQVLQRADRFGGEILQVEPDPGDVRLPVGKEIQVVVSDQAEILRDPPPPSKQVVGEEQPRVTVGDETGGRQPVDGVEIIVQRLPPGLVIRRQLMPFAEFDQVNPSAGNPPLELRREPAVTPPESRFEERDEHRRMGVAQFGEHPRRRRSALIILRRDPDHPFDAAQNRQQLEFGKTVADFSERVFVDRSENHQAAAVLQNFHRSPAVFVEVDQLPPELLRFQPLQTEVMQPHIEVEDVVLVELFIGTVNRHVPRPLLPDGP
ncbi:hypothetical protein SDC9_115480 [bioreactor metagenome]|uniref:Uncharacterized protein n=1 Tax=bioreactor metagenome TaxID=1076179 RepID=A0A645BTK4_9ZZZZ